MVYHIYLVMIAILKAVSSPGWCSGSTCVSGACSLGSNPSPGAKQLGPMVKRLGRRLLKAKSGVRFPLGLPNYQKFVITVHKSFLAAL